MTQVKLYLTWEQTQYPIQWDSNPYVWEDVAVLIEIAEGVRVGGHLDYHDAYKHLKPEKQKIVIKLIAKVKGEEFSEEKHKQDGIKVTVEDINLVMKEVLNIQINKVD